MDTKKQTNDPDPDSPLTWAAGCGACRCGVIGPDCSNGPAALYIMQAVLQRAGFLAFCSCRAGQAAERYAKRTLAAIVLDVDRVPGQMVGEIERWAADQVLPVPAVRFVAADGREVEFVGVGG